MITYSESFIDFLRNSPTKIAQVLYRAHVNKHPSYSCMLTANEINYITVRQDGPSISYLPAGKEQKYTDDGRWTLEGRQSGKPARIIRKLFTEKALNLFKDEDFDAFCNSYKSSICKGLTFSLLPNTDIPSVYGMNLTNGSGSLHKSCMNGHGKWMDMYKNCTCLKILILRDKRGLLAGRALIWELDDITLMDRIYVAEEFMYDCFINYAIDNNWWYKWNYNSYADKQTFINSAGEREDKRFSIFTKTQFDCFPYIDTFCYGGEGVLYNYKKGRYTYDSSDGLRSYETYWDQINDCSISGIDAVTIEHGAKAGLMTHIENTVRINDQYWWCQDPHICVVDGCYFNLEDTVWSEYDQRRYLRKNSVWCELHHSYISITDAVIRRGKVSRRSDATKLSHSSKQPL